MRAALYRIFRSKVMVAVLFVCMSWVSHASSVNAANLYIFPASAKVTAGNIVSVRVLVGTNGASINNAEGTVLYPSDLLDALSISKSSSVFNLWVEEPKFTNAEGKATFNGGLPSPGFSGASGEVLTITFRAKKSGTASVVFSDAAVRLNDGLGTDVLTAKGPGTIEISPAISNEVVPEIVAKGAPAAPIVVSSSHPDQGRWYSDQNLELQWEVPTDVTTVSTLINDLPVATPSVIYDPPIGNKRITGWQDGIWYFHVRFKNKNGWGQITHYKVQIDTVAPNPFKVTFPQGEVADDPRVPVSFKAIDALSGIDHYEVKVDQGAFVRVSVADMSKGPYLIAAQDPGVHSLLVKAVDMAGNETVQTAEFTVASIKAPVIQEYPSSLNEGDQLVVKGTAAPLMTIDVVVGDISGKTTTQTTKVQPDGHFAITWSKDLKKGSYTLTARATDDRGAKSAYTKSLDFTVKPSPLTSTSSFVLNWLSIVIILSLSIGFIIMLVMYLIYRRREMKKSLDYRIKVAELSMHKSFDFLLEGVRKQLSELKNTKTQRSLTEEERSEEQVMEKLEENLHAAERYIEKEISAIHK